MSSCWTLIFLAFLNNLIVMVHGNFNLFMDRREFQKLHGISSDIYYVREGVVNEYATSFQVTVPAEVEDLNFSWQALSKRPVYYEVSMDYTDFFALSQPYTNISNSGRVPQSLGTFRVTLPCSGRANAEVPVSIRMSFQVKHSTRPNITNITIKRKKICLFKEMTLKPIFDEIQNETPETKQLPTDNSTSRIKPNSGISFSTSPSLILAGLLGGCAVTASTVFLTFFICLKRKLSSETHHHFGKPLEGCGNDNPSPASLLRQQQPPQISSPWKTFGLDKPSLAPNHNSNVTNGNSWNEFSNPLNSNTNHKTQKPNGSISSKNYPPTKGSDVSPYAYAQILPPQAQFVPSHSFIGAVENQVSEWYSKHPSRNGTIAHMYPNNLQSPNISKIDQPFQTNYSTIKSTTESLIQIDGFQCKRNLINNSAVERFL